MIIIIHLVLYCAGEHGYFVQYTLKLSFLLKALRATKSINYFSSKVQLMRDFAFSLTFNFALKIQYRIVSCLGAHKVMC